MQFTVIPYSFVNVWRSPKRNKVFPQLQYRKKEKIIREATDWQIGWLALKLKSVFIIYGNTFLEESNEKI